MPETNSLLGIEVFEVEGAFEMLEAHVAAQIRIVEDAIGDCRAGFEVDLLNAAVERETTGALPEGQDESIGPKEWLRILSALRRRCEDEGIAYPLDAKDEKLILAGAAVPA